MATEQDKVKAAMAAHAKVIVGDGERKQEMCMQEVKMILQKYNCDLVPTVIFSPGKTEFMINTILVKPSDQRKQGQEHAAHQKRQKDQKEDVKDLRKEEGRESLLRVPKEGKDKGDS
jgi:hypothetical protein